MKAQIPVTVISREVRICRRLALCALALALLPGCGGGPSQKAKNQDFFTSGSRQADQRAEQRMAQSAELNGSGQTSERETKGTVSPGSPATSTNGGTNAVLAKGKTVLYDRL